MTQQHPITPPSELLKQWEDDWFEEREHADVLLIQAFQAGADAELEACCQALYDRYDSVRHATGFPGSDMSDWLRAARRPKPPSLKEQALTEFDSLLGDSDHEGAAIILRALEQLPDHE